MLNWPGSEHVESGLKRSSFFSIIIVNWNSCDLLSNCLDSIHKTESHSDYEIIVVDNASTDNSVFVLKTKYPHVRLIENKENLGFSQGTNIGIRSSRGDFILLLNSDTEFKDPDTLIQVEQFLSDHPEVGILGLNLIFPNGVSQTPGGKFISNWQLFKDQVLFLNSPTFFNLKTRFSFQKQDKFYEIDYVSGACLFVRKKVIEEIGLLEESFFMYSEDMEFCYRAKKNNWKNGILPSIRVVHLKSQSTKQNIEKILIHSIKNNCYCINKFYGKKKSIITHLIYMIGLSLRFFLSFIRKNENPISYLKLIYKNYKLVIT